MKIIGPTNGIKEIKNIRANCTVHHANGEPVTAIPGKIAAIPKWQKINRMINEIIAAKSFDSTALVMAPKDWEQH